MPVITQAEFAQQMVAQIRLLKPSLSAEVGTPERLILDVAAGALADSSIDLVGLQKALDIDSKFGSNLDNFLAIFSFARQKPAFSIGFVVFSRPDLSNVDITIPQGTLLQSVVNPGNDGPFPQFETTASVILKTGTLTTGLVPVASTTPGAKSNVPAGAITNLTVGEPVFGVTAVNNPTATTGGLDAEDDNSFKVRFKNTVFRNLSGTQDQYLALAIATAFTTKANVVGPISKYQEYVQVPQSDDATSVAYGGATPYPGSAPAFVTVGNSSGKVITVASTSGYTNGMTVVVYKEGINPSAVTTTAKITSILTGTTFETDQTIGTLKNVVVLIGTTVSHPNEWTTALSTIPYAKDIWKTLPVFVSDSISGISKFFFREGVDFNFNFPGKLQGDTLRAFIDGTGVDPRTHRLGKTQPNVTFTNVYQGANEAVQAISPNDVVLIEYSYTSTSSRNSLLHNVTNAVDVYVDGQNAQPSTTIFTAPLSSNSQEFLDLPNSMYYYENYRRDGEPTKRPQIGNILTPLYQQPVTSLPEQLIIGSSTYYLGVHYWLIRDVSEYGGTIRARDGIEWSKTLPGDGGVGGGAVIHGRPIIGGSLGEAEPEYTGTKFSTLTSPTSLEVADYTYDKNIVDLQAALEAARQITTDTLAHKARLRFFKLDITVIYTPQSTQSTVNAEIRKALSTFLANQYFGAVIRLSDLLQQIHNVTGVENVRWSNDVPRTENFIRVSETDNNGLSLLGVTTDRVQWGTATEFETQGLYVSGIPTGGSFVLNYGATPTASIAISTLTATTIQTALNAVLTGSKSVVVTEDVRSTVADPLRSFRITFNKKEIQSLLTVSIPAASPLTGGEFVFDTDFFLRDNELPILPEGLQPGDTLPGLIIRPRAQNVWEKA